MRTLISSIPSIAILALCLAVPAPSSATTVGGHSTSTVGAFVLSGGHLVVPTFLSDDPGDWVGGIPSSNVGLQSYGRPTDSWNDLRLESSTAHAVSGPPVIAALGRRTATAWTSAGTIASALLDRFQSHASGPISRTPAAGAIRDLDIAVELSGRRAIAWSDDTGVRLQVMSAVGLIETTTLLSPTPSTRGGIAVIRDDQGGWWTMWSTASGHTAVHTGSDGALRATRDLGRSDAHDDDLDFAPGSDTLRPWRLVPDGHGGIWVGLSRRVAHVADTGVHSTLRIGIAQALTLASGDRSTASAVAGEHGGIVVRRLSSHLGRATHLPGWALDLAVDRARGTIEVLSERSGHHIWLSHIARSGRVTRSRELPFCAGTESAQLLASGGDVVVACQGHEEEAESVETGGDFRYGYDIGYEMLRGGRVVDFTAAFVGDYSY